MTVLELAEYLNVKVGWVYDRWRDEGIPAIRVGQSLRFRRSDVDKWLESRSANSAA